MSPQEEQPLFIADRMLGRLARYLRMLGYDVAYPPPCADARLIAMARSEHRVLITRDRGITRGECARKGSPRAVEIDADEVEEQVSQLAGEGWLKSIHASRCGSCNTLLERMSTDEARHLLPPFTAATQCEFLYCSNCNVIFWRGSHWSHFMNMISKVLGPRP